MNSNHKTRILLLSVLFMMIGASAVFAQGMMHGRGWQSWGRTEVNRISIEQAAEIAEDFINGPYSPRGLKVLEIMEFNENFYVQLADEETGEAAMEVLIDPAGQGVYPEPGPNMMWNEIYGHMGSSIQGFGHMGGMWGGRGRRGWSGMMGSSRYWGTDNEPDSANRSWGMFRGNRWNSTPITEAEAISLAQEYLDRTGSGLAVDDHGTLFPGYFTFHTLKNGTVEGMISVNIYDGSSWYHDWHGEYIGEYDGDDH